MKFPAQIFAASLSCLGIVELLVPSVSKESDGRQIAAAASATMAKLPSVSVTDEAYKRAVETLVDLTSSESEVVLSELRAMRANQHRHEQTWALGREAISSRFNQQRELNKMLQSVGGQAGTDERTISQQEQHELAAYDHKLRLAMASMYRSQERELELLGIHRLSNQEQNKQLYSLMDEILDLKPH